MRSRVGISVRLGLVSLGIIMLHAMLMLTRLFQTSFRAIEYPHKPRYMRVRRKKITKTNSSILRKPKYAMKFLPLNFFSKQVKGSPKRPQMISRHNRSLHAFQCSGHVLCPWTHEWRNLPDASCLESRCPGGKWSRG